VKIFNINFFIKFFIFLSIFYLYGCTPPPPKNVDNICSIFSEYKNWYWITKCSERQWGVPISVQMAIIHQESKFNGKAQPLRTKLLWVIPWKRPSTAYGYSQALQTTWDHYLLSLGLTRRRSDFASASDFIGWYSNQAYKKANIKKDNAYQLYLAYHEGIGGYLKKTYLKKPWLIAVAHKVSARSQKYQSQLNTCEKKFKKKWWHLI